MLLPPGSRRARGRPSERFVIERQGRGFRVLGGEEPTSALVPLALACEILEGRIALHVAARAPRHVFIHTGVVIWRGRALLLPGRSKVGKSTLVRFLVRCGARYYSDEYAVLDESGRVLPYPRPLALRTRSGVRRLRMPRPRATLLRVGWVVGLRYDAAARDALSVEPMSAGQTALLLLDNAVAARLAPERVLPAVRTVAAGAEGLRGVRGEAALAATTLLSRIASGRRA